jgi:hypothetical protein
MCVGSTISLSSSFHSDSRIPPVECHGGHGHPHSPPGPRREAHLPQQAAVRGDRRREIRSPVDRRHGRSLQPEGAAAPTLTANHGRYGQREQPPRRAATARAAYPTSCCGSGFSLQVVERRWPKRAAARCWPLPASRGAELISPCELRHGDGGGLGELWSSLFFALFVFS